MSQRSYGNSSRQAQQQQQQMRSQFGNNNLSRNAPQHFSNQPGASAGAGSFDWSSTPAEGMPWGGRGGSATMSQASAQPSRKPGPRTQLASSQSFRGQGQMAQSADPYGHGAIQKGWDTLREPIASIPRSSNGNRKTSLPSGIVGIPMKKTASQQQKTQQGTAASLSNAAPTQSSSATSNVQRGKRNWGVADMHNFIHRQSGGREFAGTNLPQEFQHNMINIGGRTANLPPELAAYAQPFVPRSQQQQEQDEDERRKATPNLTPPQQLEQQRRQMAERMQQERIQKQQQQMQQQQQQQNRVQQPVGYMGPQMTADLIQTMNSDAIVREGSFAVEDSSDRQMNEILQAYGRPMPQRATNVAQAGDAQAMPQPQQKTVVRQPVRGPPPISIQNAPPKQPAQNISPEQIAQLISQMRPEQRQSLWDQQFKQQQEIEQKQREQPGFMPPPQSDDQSSFFEKERQNLESSVQKSSSRLQSQGGQSSKPQLKTLAISKTKASSATNSTAAAPAQQQQQQQQQQRPAWVPPDESPAPALPSYTSEQKASFQAAYMEQMQKKVAVAASNEQTNFEDQSTAPPQQEIEQNGENLVTVEDAGSD